MELLDLVLEFFLTVIFTLQTLLFIVFAVLRSPFKSLKRQVREVPPDCLLDPSLGTHEYVTANGIKFHYVAAGDPSKPLMLFLHGFPEFWFSWRHQMREFSRDYRVVAVDLRGYGGTDKPPRKSDYTPSKLTQDIIELIPALGYQKCVLVSHDWGGVIGWSVAQKDAHLVHRHIVMNCPHPRIFQQHIARSWNQVFMSWYMFMFQMPWLPEVALSLNDLDALEEVFRVGKGGAQNKTAFTDDVIEAYKYTFSQPRAFTPPINYYRNMAELENECWEPMNIPILLIWGDDDVALDSAMADKHTSVCTNITIKHIPNCSHWVQQDSPELVNQYMREFLVQ